MNGKSLLVALVVLLSLEKVTAQKVELELFVRPVLTSLRGSEVVKDNFAPTLYLAGGIGVNVFVTENSLINLSVLYDKKGAHGDVEAPFRDANNNNLGTVTTTNIADFSYLTIPIQYGYRFGRKVQYQVGVGFYGSFLLAAESGAKSPGVYDVREDNTDSYKKGDAGLSASFNMFVPAGKRIAFKFGLDNNLGLVNVGLNMADDNTLKHNSLGLVVGMKYALGNI